MITLGATGYWFFFLRNFSKNTELVCSYDHARRIRVKDDYGKGGYERLTGLKRTYPQLKVSLAIGGWNEGSVNYSLLVADAYLRQKFIKQTLNFLRKYNFDGLDLHWKYPTQRVLLLTKELREEFSQYNLILTASIGSVKYAIDQAYDVPQLSQYLDFFHVMCYDYHGHWDNKIGYNAPLMGENVLDVMNVKFTIEYLIALGAPPSKLVLGLPFYGRTFKTSLDGKIGDDTDGMTFQGPFTAESGFLGYNEICLEIYNKISDWTISWDVNSSQMHKCIVRNDSPIIGTNMVRQNFKIFWLYAPPRS